MGGRFPSKFLGGLSCAANDVPDIAIIPAKIIPAVNALFIVCISPLFDSSVIF